MMSKQQKGNREAKKPKAETNEMKKQKKDPRRYDGDINILFRTSK